MSEFNRPNVYGMEGTDSLSNYYTKVFFQMGIGLAITTVVAYLGYQSFMNNGIVAKFLMGLGPIGLLLLMGVELGIGFAMGSGVTHFAPTTTRLLFYLYSTITGLTFSVIPMAYGVDTVFVAFLFASVLFGACAVIGKITNVDLSKFSGILMGGLVALVALSVISIFVPVLRNSLFIGYFGLILFLGITAYDMQKIKNFYYQVNDELVRENLAVYAAFELYLDFINILLYIIRILSHSRRD
ncbi:MAG: Bax inhibitor-1/YccA family protein [Solobacterium sp.]|nr:Bax inhibitor-1/YccA family protein [Solobacterium sp.]